MFNIEEELVYEIDWRINEISILKTVPYLFSLSDKQRNTIERYSIPALYSLWEGFIVAAFTIYTRELNSLKLNYERMSDCILTHAIDIEVNLTNGRSDFGKKQRLVNEIYKYYFKDVRILPQIPTNSNVNYKVINTILQRFNLSILPEKPHKKRLDKLLLFRNKIAHGESSVPVDKHLISEMSFTVIELMHEVFNLIMEGFTNKTYLRVTSGS